MIQDTLKESYRLWWPLIVENWMALFAIHAFGQLHIQYFLYLMKLYPYDSSLQMLCQFSISMVAMVEAIFLIMLIPMRILEKHENLERGHFWPFFRSHIGPLTLEGLRMGAKLILYYIALIIPGIYKQVRWSFMPFVVMFNPRYEAGEVNPLEESSRLTQGVAWMVFVVSLVDTLINFYADKVAMDAQFLPTEVMFIAISLLTMAISVYTYSVIFTLYEKQNKKLREKHETTV